MHDLAGNRTGLTGYAAQHVGWSLDPATRVATVTLDRPERKNPTPSCATCFARWLMPTTSRRSC
jgi:hypothetical protein